MRIVRCSRFTIEGLGIGLMSDEDEEKPKNKLRRSKTTHEIRGSIQFSMNL